MKKNKLIKLKLTTCIVIFLFPLFAFGQQFFNDYKTTFDCGITSICGQLSSPHSSKTVLGPDGYYKLVIENGVTATTNILTKINFDGDIEYSKVGVGTFGLAFVNSTSSLQNIEISDLIYHNDFLYVSYNVIYTVSSPGPDIFHSESNISKIDLNGNAIWENIFQIEINNNPFGVNLIVNDLELTNNGIAYVGTRVEDEETTKLVYGKIGFDGNPIFTKTYIDEDNNFSTRGLNIKSNKSIGENFDLYIGGSLGSDSGIPDNQQFNLFLLGVESDGDINWGRRISNLISFPGFNGLSGFGLGRKMPMSVVSDSEKTEIFVAGSEDLSLEDFDLVKVVINQGWVSLPISLKIDYSSVLTDGAFVNEIFYSGKGNFIGVTLNSGFGNSFGKSNYVRVNLDSWTTSVSRFINNNSHLNSIFIHNTPGVGTQFLLGGLFIKNGVHRSTLTRLSSFDICEYVPEVIPTIFKVRKLKGFSLSSSLPDFFLSIVPFPAFPTDGDFSQNELCDFLFLNDFQEPNDGELGIVQSSTLQTNKNRISSFFPNPMSDESSIQLFLETEKEVSFQIYNTLGQNVLNKNFGKLKGNLTLELEVTELEIGLYFVHILKGKDVTIKQVSIVR